MTLAAGEVMRLMQARDWAGALDRIDRALIVDAQDPRFLMQRAQCLMALGRKADAFASAAQAERCAATDPAILDAAGTLYSYGNDHRRALPAYDRAVALAPRNAHFLYNRATVRRFLGLLADAEDDYDRVIALRPMDFEAYKNRTDLRTQTAERNHVRELEAIASRPMADWRGEVQIRYALAKEYEDLGDHAKSFEQLARGATTRRKHLKYDIATDVATVQWIMDAFPGAAAAAQNHCEEAPIFVVGLPRSGTTLAERILASHPQVFSAGELDCFALSVVDAVRRRTGLAQLPRRDLVANSAALDFAALGRDYLQRANHASGGSGRFIDKMPLNYLYCGLIRRALPNAKIVHLTRDPMAVCYAMFKTLFRDGYPFSYDLDEIGRYYIAYRRLMAHWQAVEPHAIHHLSYEALVADQLGETRKLLAFCGLDWQDDCVQFHDNPAASTTASAAQIRRPIYDSSVSQWRHYEMQLAGLRGRLEAAGIET
ncbi:MAG TPA: sulfotransferase [Steroidobacteraceae bacterium]|nr:sulfotransferase [Steroidobacteraceae bacterium]